MHAVKKLAKRLLPDRIKEPVANSYHLAEAVAANVRHGFPGRDMQVIMITGTNGKTTTAAYLVKILQAAGHKVGASTTAFYQVGERVVPNEDNMTVVGAGRLQALLAEMKAAGCEYAVLEVTSNALVQHRVWGVPCDVAVMTNLTQDHLDYHKSMERYAAAKAKLFAWPPRLAILNRDDEWFDYYRNYRPQERMLAYGTDTAADVRIQKVALHKDGSDMTIQFDGAQTVQMHTQLAGKYNVYNAVAAAAAAYALQIETEHIAAGVAALSGVAGRLEPVEAGQPFQVFVDYAHTPDALQKLLENLQHMTSGNVWLVFGACGDRDRSKRPAMGEIAVEYADRIVLTDEESYNEDPAQIRAEIYQGITKAGGQDKTTEIADRREAMAHAFAHAKPGDIVAVTGMGHEVFRIINGVRHPWNDAAVARELLQK